MGIVIHMTNITPKQKNFIAKLVAERGGQMPVDIDTYSVKTASAYITALLAKKPEGKATAPKAKLPEVPEGHYAVESLTGHNDLDFFRVDRPTEGKWAGYTFVKRVIGGRPDSRVPRSQIAAVLTAIAADPEANVRYGREIGRCYRCNRHLTDETSRSLGIGPDCRSGL